MDKFLITGRSTPLYSSSRTGRISIQNTLFSNCIVHHAVFYKIAYSIVQFITKFAYPIVQNCKFVEKFTI